jgi:hypothetical protein
VKRKYVVVRTYSAGVEVGELVERKDKEVTLANSRKIWQWQGAFTLHEIAVSGVGKGTRMSVEVSKAIVTEAIEVLTCTEEAEKNLREFKAYAP